MHDTHAAHGTLRSYLTGFVLSVVLTVIPFALVMAGGLPRSTVIPAIVGLAIAQILVHLRYFLHLDSSREQSWNVTSFVFTVLVVAILVGGSLWIMINIHHMMVP
jgi:cytochrome o ubiquinol oxidase subunit IV